MAHIYAEMLVVDQWLLEHARFRTQADTSLVYEPIFESYGYTTEDYRASVEYYMNDPERYSRILRSTSDILEKKIEELKLIKAKEDREKAVVPYRINPDSLTPVYELSFHEVSDTLFDGLNIVINVDTLAVKDTLQLKDSISVEKPEPKEEVAPTEEPTIVKEQTIIKEPLPVKNPVSVKETTPKSVQTVSVKPNQTLVKEPQRLLSTTLDSLKRK